MNLMAALIIFVLFWWALLVTIFCYQLHKENEDFAKRLGRRTFEQKKAKYELKIQNRDSFFLPDISKPLQHQYNRISIIKFWRLLPLKINFK